MVGVWPEVEPRAGVSAQRRGEAAEGVLRLGERDLFAMLGQRESGGETADPATDDDRVTQSATSLIASGIESVTG